MPWLIASGNAHKIREIGQVLARFDIDLVNPRDAGIDLDVDEWGATFAENAVIKAIAYAESYGGPVIADDSGLEVRHLNWGPGVYSARYAGAHCDDEDNNAKLLRELEGVDSEGRSARYRCVIGIAWPPGTYSGEEPTAGGIKGIGANDARVIDGYVVRTFDGALEGRIESERRGERGFGYDPYFCLPNGKHVAEMPDDAKHAISHRGEALRKLVGWLETR